VLLVHWKRKKNKREKEYERDRERDSSDREQILPTATIKGEAGLGRQVCGNPFMMSRKER
jgi:hypothetical protein